jgi:hypothetical protein
MVQALTVFALALIPFFFSSFTNWFIDLLNVIITAIGPAAIRVIGLFPPNPCLSVLANCSDGAMSFVSSPTTTAILEMIAWVFPLAYLINLVGCIMFSVMCYFLIAPLARWFKLLT